MVTAVLASPVAAQERGTVTRAEYAKIKVGMTRERVERIFNAGRGCDPSATRSETYRQYRQANGYYTAVMFNRERDGQMRVADDQPSYKQWDTSKSC